MKRYRRISAKPDELLVKFGRDDCGDLGLLYAYPDRDGKAATKLLSHALESMKPFDGKSVVQELQARGYDIETFVLRVKKVKSLTTGAG